MPESYVERRIKEALKKANGNALKARQLIISWCMEDVKLLQSLTKAHLNGIVAYNIERVMAGRNGEKQKAPAAAPAPAKAAAATGKKPGKNAFGKEILRAVAGDKGAQFGLEGYGPIPKRGKASQQHINALKLMAAKSKTKNS